MLNTNHHIVPAVLPYLRSLSFVAVLEIYLILCIAFKLQLLDVRSELSLRKDADASPRKTGSAIAGYWPLALFLGLAALWAQFVIILPGTGDVFFDHAIGCNATTTLFMGLHLLTAEPNLPVTSRTGGIQPPANGEVRKPSWKSWLSRAYALRMAPRRGVQMLQKTERHPTTIRCTFLTGRAFHLVGNFVLLDLLNTIAFRIPFFQPTPSRGPRPFRLEELPLSLLHGGMIYAGLNIMYDVYCLLSVSAESTKPEEWPPLFGDIRDAWTVQRAWR